jgi:hypothetical protein
MVWLRLVFWEAVRTDFRKVIWKVIWKVIRKVIRKVNRLRWSLEAIKGAEHREASEDPNGEELHLPNWPVLL